MIITAALLYTGGTIGMIADPEGENALIPGTGKKITDILQNLDATDCNFITVGKPKDSSDIGPQDWREFEQAIIEHAKQHTCLILLHGTDTLAFTAAALQFLFALQETPLPCPLILTGAQYPLGAPGSDAGQNLSDALRLGKYLAEKLDTQNDATDIMVVFGGEIFAANRVSKFSSSSKNAFWAPDGGKLGTIMGGEIELTSSSSISRADLRDLPSKLSAGNPVDILYFTPWMRPEDLARKLDSEHQAYLLLAYGAGNCPTDPSFGKLFSEAVQEKGKCLLALTQCPHGGVKAGTYAAGNGLWRGGVIDGKDMTIEAAMVKLALAASVKDKTKAKLFLETNICGEFSATNCHPLPEEGS